LAKNVVIVGLGRFGSVLAKALTESGYDVLGIDSRQEKVRELADSIGKVVQGQATDPQLWRDLLVNGADIGIIAFSSSLEDNVLTALLLRKTGVKRVIALSRSDLHSELLRSIGVDHVVEPQVDSALQLAHTLGTQLQDYLEVTKDFGVCKITADRQLKRLTVRQLNDEKKVTVLVLHHGNRVMLQPPDPHEIAEGDTLVVAGRDEHLRALTE
jgi:trk system potassium uptake protein TrkA